MREGREPARAGDFSDAVFICTEHMQRGTQPEINQILLRRTSEIRTEQTIQVRPVKPDMPGNIRDRNIVIIIMLYIIDRSGNVRIPVRFREKLALRSLR